MARSQRRARTVQTKRQGVSPVLYVLAAIGALVVLTMAVSAVSSIAGLERISSFNVLSGVESLAIAFIGTVLSFEFFLAVIILVLLVFFAVKSAGRK